MSSLFGVELPTAVNFVIAFVFVLLLIAAAAWLVRRFGAAKIDAAARSRQPRLAVIDSAAVDGRRKLVIIRRDNVEHLLMIGGPSDVVVETNIVRGAAATAREATPTRSGAAELMPRAMPLPDPTPWPLQPEPVAPIPAAPTVRVMPRAPADEAWQTPSEPPAPPMTDPRAARPADTLAGLAEELGHAEPAQPRAAPIAPARTVLQPAAAAVPPAADQSLAEMAQRLEAALRRPMAQKITAETPRVTATLDVKAGVPRPPMSPRTAAAARPGVPQAPAGNLEQEMANLLGRPGKT